MSVHMRRQLLESRAGVGVLAALLVGVLTAGGLLLDLLPALTLGAVGVVAAGLFTTTAARINAPVILPAVVFVMLVTPLLRVMLPVANVPIYFLDALLGLSLGLLLLEGQRGAVAPDWGIAAPLPQLVLLMWIPSTALNYFHEAMTTGVMLETTYTFLRYVLLLSICYSLVCRVRTESALRVVLAVMLIAAALSGLVAITQYLLPPSHPLIGFYDALSPRNLTQRQERYLLDYGTVRAHGLVGSGMALGTMLSVTIALGISMVLSERFRQWRGWMIAAMALSLVGLLVTNSRTAYLSITLVVLVHLVQNQRHRVSMAALVGLGLVAVYIVTGVTGLVNLDFISERIALTSDLDNYANASRLLVFERMVEFLQSDPKHIVFGIGDSTVDLLARGLIPYDPEIPVGLHNTFVMVVIYRGLLSGMVFAAIFVTALWLLLRPVAPDNPYLWLVQGMRAALVGLLPLLLFDHSVVSTPGYQAFVYAVVGLVIVSYRLAAQAVHTDRPFYEKRKRRRGMLPSPLWCV